MQKNKTERIVLVVICMILLVIMTVLMFRDMAYQGVPGKLPATGSFFTAFSLVMLFLHALLGYFTIQGRKTATIVFGILMVLNGLSSARGVMVLYDSAGAGDWRQLFAAMAMASFFFVCGYRLASMGFHQESTRPGYSSAPRPEAPQPSSPETHGPAPFKLPPLAGNIEKYLYVLPLAAVLGYLLWGEITSFLPKADKIILQGLFFALAVFLGFRTLQGKRIETFCFAAYSILAGLGCLAMRAFFSDAFRAIKPALKSRFKESAVQDVSSSADRMFVVLCLLGLLLCAGGVRLIFIALREQREAELGPPPPGSGPAPRATQRAPRLTGAKAKAALRAGLILFFIYVKLMGAYETLYIHPGPTASMVRFSIVEPLLAVTMGVLALMRFRLPTLFFGIHMMFNGGLKLYLTWLDFQEWGWLVFTTTWVWLPIFGLVFILGGAWLLVMYSRESKPGTQLAA